MAIHFSQRVHLFDKRARGKYRRTGEGRIFLNRKLFWTRLIQVQKKIFSFKKGFFTAASDPPTLYLMKTDPAGQLKQVGIFQH